MSGLEPHSLSALVLVTDDRVWLRAIPVLIDFPGGTVPARSAVINGQESPVEVSDRGHGIGRLFLLEPDHSV